MTRACRVLIVLAIVALAAGCRSASEPEPPEPDFEALFIDCVLRALPDSTTVSECFERNPLCGGTTP